MPILAIKSETPIGILLSTVFNSILQVFLICLAGYILASAGILDKRTQKQLNKLNVSLFTPALLFSKVAFFLTPSKLRELWIVPIFFVLVTIVSMVTAQVLGYVLRLKRSQRAFATAASMFMNSNSLPIALMQSLVTTVPHLKWGPEDEPDAMVGRALTYLVMYSTLGMVLRWSYGVRLLAQADDEVTEQQPADPENANERTPLLNKSTNGSTRRPTLPQVAEQPAMITEHLHSEPEPLPAVSVLTSSPQTSHQQLVQSPTFEFPEPSPAVPSTKSLRPPMKKRTTTFYNSFPNTPNASRSSVNLPPVFQINSERSLARTSSSQTLSTEYSSDASDDEQEDSPDLAASTSSVAVDRRQHSISDGSETAADADVDGPANDEDSPLLKKPVDHISFPQRPAPMTRKSTRASRRSTRSHQTRRTCASSMLKIVRNVVVWCKQLALKVNSFMTVPLWAALLSLIVACIPPLQHFLVVHAWPIKGALETTGSVSIPMTLVVLGAYFCTPTDENDTRSLKQKIKDYFLYFSRQRRQQRKEARERSRTLEERHIAGVKETRTVWVGIASRMLLTPLIIMPLMVVSTVFDIQKVFADPVFVVANVLLISSPPALTLAQITQAASGDAFERLISRTIFWSYCVVTPPATIIYVVIGLILSKL